MYIDGMYAAFEPGGNAAPVLLCAPYGNVELCSYRPLRAWAKSLAAAGHPVLRFDLPTTGDSAGGPWQEDRVQAWIEGVAIAARWLCAETSRERVCAIGVGLGGLLALAADAPIGDLVLWAVPSRGRTLVREMRALAGMEAAAGAEPDPQLREGALASAGFVLSAASVAALEALEPAPAPRRMLLIERDGIGVDKRLRVGDFTVVPGPGYGEMVAAPQGAKAPQEVFATVQAWLADSATPRATSAALSTDVLELPGMTERLIAGLPAIVTQPPNATLTAVLLNAGGLRRTGPNRMWVEAARRWATHGVATVRLDLPGIGDADGDDGPLANDEAFYTPDFVADTLAALDALADAGLPERFVLGGLCSGAYWGLHAALADARIRGVLMLNPKALFWDPQLDSVRAARNLAKLRDPARWAKLVRGQITRERVIEVAAGARVAVAARLRGPRADELDETLARLEQQGQRGTLIFTPDEVLLGEMQANGQLERMQASSAIDVVLLDLPAASHTLEPVILQRGVHAAMDAALLQALGDLRRDDRP